MAEQGVLITSVDPSANPMVRVMTWNIQSGFSIDNYWDLERQARVIKGQEPDVVILQEVSRGWLVTSYADELLWLSRRLDMPYVWGPASDDDLWGNAILSRAPLSDVSVLKYRSTENLKRSAVRAKLATDAGEVWIVATSRRPGRCRQHPP
jgi:endonuclease/exonuclease/phosphatase family metal-dependent hydrolase